jgi:hypothetical protein
LQVPNCSKAPNSARRRRQDSGDDGSPATIEVFNGLYVNEGADTTGLDSFDDVSRERVRSIFRRIKFKLGKKKLGCLKIECCHLKKKNTFCYNLKKIYWRAVN